MKPEINQVMGGIRRLAGNVAVAQEIEARINPMVEAADGKGVAHETLKEIAMWLLSEGNALNIMHWNVGTSHKHKVLNEAYDLCRDTGDKLAETYIAKTGNECFGTVPAAKVERKSGDEGILARLREINNRMNDAVAKNPKFTEGVKNIFADFDEKMTGLIYNYSQFDS